jgi:hypothetical protein
MSLQARRGHPTVNASSGKMSGSELDPLTSYEVMWFAWYAFFPETKVLS